MNQPGSRFQWRRKLPEILIEAASVMFAVLLALFVDEWREEREIEERARLVEVAIESEIRANAEELAEASDARHRLMAQLQRDLEAINAGEADSLGVNFDLTLLSGSAWRAAAATSAMTRIPFERLNSFSEVYQLQALYDETQRNFMNYFLSVAELNDPDEAQLARGFISRLGMLIELQDALIDAYEGVAASPP